MNEEAMTPDKEQVVEPLTTEEIEDIRVRGTNLALVDPRFYSLWDVINRLLATLDAARTASVAGLDRQVAYDAMLAVKPARDIDDADYAMADAIFNALNSAPSIEQEAGETLRAAAGEMVAWSVMEVRPGQYQCRVCGADVTRATAPHEDDCESDALYRALHPRAALEADRNPQETER